MKLNLQDFDAVAFDVEGTLADTIPTHHAAGEIKKDGSFKDHATIKQIVRTKEDHFVKLAEVGFQAMPGAVDFVKDIATHFAGRLSLVTSASERFVLPFLKRNNLEPYFPLLISYDTVEAAGLEPKPAPDPYLLAMERLGAKKLLVFEDTVSGVASAKQAGATVVALGFDRHNAALFAGGDLQWPPDVVVADYTEARQILGL